MASASAWTSPSPASRSAACAASNWVTTARRASWSTCRARTRTGCAPLASSRWSAAWWAAPSCAPSPACRPTRRCPTAPRALLVGDAGAEIPHLLSAAKDLLQNLTALTATDSALDASLHNVEGVTGKLNGPSGAMGLIAGDDKEAQKLLARANQLVTTMNELAHKTDSLIGNADRRVFGKDGVMTDTQATIVQLNGLLADARASLKKMDAVLIEAQAVGANAREASADLGSLRAEVESNLRHVEQLVNEINRKWPFKHDTEIKLP